MNAFFCRTASLLWSTVNAAARSTRRFTGRKPVRLDAGLVISVGNLQAGGAGKTPLVARLARELGERELKVAILCRGYGGLWETRGGLISPGATVVDPMESGDEAALAHMLAPRAWIGVGADRVESCRRMAAASGGRPDVVLLDDGFQHFGVARDVDVLAVTSHSPWVRVHRDFLGRAAEAGLVVWTKGEALPPAAAFVRAPTLRARFMLEPPDPVRRDQGHWLVTGVGDPEETRRSFEAAGFRIERQTVFRDHARYSSEWIEDCLRKGTEAGLRVLVTGKDAVKWRSLGISPMRFDEREPRLEFAGDGEAIWSELVSGWIRSVRGLDFRSGSP